MEITPHQYRKCLLELSEANIADTPEFVFMLATKIQLLENKFAEDEARTFLAAHTVPLPAGATVDELKEMGSFYAEVLTRCFNDLVNTDQFEEPIVEAAALANKVLLATLSKAASSANARQG
jgi:hypothetical protein